MSHSGETTRGRCLGIRTEEGGFVYVMRVGGACSDCFVTVRGNRSAGVEAEGVLGESQWWVLGGDDADSEGVRTRVEVGGQNGALASRVAKLDGPGGLRFADLTERGVVTGGVEEDVLLLF